MASSCLSIRIYAAAFSGEPWFDNWKAENAEIHVREILESEQSYGLEYVKDDEICGFILGSSMLFSYGRTFEINDLAVDPKYQGKGIGSSLIEEILKEIAKEYRFVRLMVVITNEQAKHFWSKNRFQPTGLVLTQPDYTVEILERPL